jgi:hypothetical protein
MLTEHFRCLPPIIGFSNAHAYNNRIIPPREEYGDKEPGPGFYDKARALGYRFNEPYIFWAQQVGAVFKVHGKPPRTGPAA